MLHVHHTSRASGTVERLEINLLLIRFMNETEIFERNFIFFSKYQIFSGCNFSLTLSIYIYEDVNAMFINSLDLVSIYISTAA